MRHKKKAEIIILGIILAIAFHVLQERIVCRAMPSGDEGSWMAVATQLSKGQGFTTKWLEYTFLSHWDLPRPDDFRYPGLVGIMALTFKIFGTSFTVGLWTVGVIFMAFCMAFYCAIRKAFGVSTAIVSTTLTVLSLLQLYWNTRVYTEGLFGVLLALLVLWATMFKTNQMRFWIYTGVTIGCLYLVRPNALLFMVALAATGILKIYGKKTRSLFVVVGVLAFLAVVAPWLARMQLQFGNPFHVAANAGLARVSITESPAKSAMSFFASNSLMFYPKSIVIGLWHMIAAWDDFEHGMEFIPVFFAGIAAVRRKTFFGPGILLGFGLSFLACCYVGYLYPWAAIRYFVSFIPFLYAYGIHEAIAMCKKYANRFLPGNLPYSASLVLLACCIPIYYPHKYYERVLPKTPKSDQVFNSFVKPVQQICKANDVYCARSLAQLNFLCDRKCVGVQTFFDSTQVDTIIKRFHPRLITVTAEEDTEPVMKGIIDKFKAVSDTFYCLRKNPNNSFYVLKK